MSKGRSLVALAAAVCALTVTLGASAFTSVTITTPKAGQKISLKQNSYTAIAGTVSFAPSTATDTKYYLRRDGCGTSNDNPHLSTTSGTDGGDGCGLIVNAVVGLGGDADQAAFVDFPASDGLPLAYDATRPITGTIDLQGAGVGAAQVDVSLEGLINGDGVALGSDTETAVLDPTLSDNEVPFTIQPNGSLDGSDLQGVDLRVHIHGPQIYSGFIGNSGKSWVDVPSYSASVNRSVRVSIDDPSFANPIPARIDSSGSNWSLAVPTPGIGGHTIYAQSTQGYDTSSVTTRSFNVTK